MNEKTEAVAHANAKLIDSLMTNGIVAVVLKESQSVYLFST